MIDEDLNPTQAECDDVAVLMQAAMDVTYPWLPSAVTHAALASYIARVRERYGEIEARRSVAIAAAKDRKS